MKTKNEMIESCKWLGSFVAFHKIGEYSIIEYKAKVFKDGSPVNGQFEETSNWHPFINGNNISRSYSSLDECLAGVIAIKNDGINTRADTYFIKAITPTPKY